MMFGKVTKCARGVMIEYDNEWYLVQGMGCNPFVEAKTFDPMLHLNIVRQVYLPPVFYPMLKELLA